MNIIDKMLTSFLALSEYRIRKEKISMANSKPILVSCPRFWSQVRGHKLSERFITYMSLNQDSICDANCRGCFRYPERKTGLKDLLSMPDYFRLLDEFARFGGLALEISGEGEPMLSKNTLPIIRHATSLGLWTTLITNGHSLNIKLLQELREMKVALVLSLHSLKKEVYERDSGILGSFDKKIAVIELASQIFKGSDWRENGRSVRRVAVHWTLQADNLLEIRETRRFCRERDLLFSIAPLAHTGHAAKTPELWLPEKISRIEKTNELGDESIIFYDEANGRQVCGTCKYGLNIGADGNLLLDAHGGYEVELANIRDISFKKAVELQHIFSKKMFKKLDYFCPVRDPKWQGFLNDKEFL